MKGVITDLIFIMVIILIVAISLVVVKTLHTALAPSFDPAYMAKSEIALSTFNGSMIFIVVGFIAAMIILAATINAHPMFAFAMIIVMIFIVILAAIFSNVFGAVAADTHLSAAAATMPETTTIFSHLPLIMLAASIVTIIVLFGKGRGEA